MDLSRTNSENLNVQQITIRNNRSTNINNIRRQQSSDSNHSINSSSSEDLDDLCIDHALVDIDEVVAPKKPHFLDYDAVPPPGFENDVDSSISINKLIQKSKNLNIKTITPGVVGSVAISTKTTATKRHGCSLCSTDNDEGVCRGSGR